MDQHTAEWWEARRGKVTASRIGDIMGRKKGRKGEPGDWTAKRQNYLDEKVAERITGKNRDRKKVASLDHRLELEPDARAAYEFYSDNTLTLVGFIDHPTIPDSGASPDSLVNDNGGLEIKCPDSTTHIDILLAGDIDRDYFYQCQFGMACTGRAWWDFVSFDPDQREELKLFVKRIDRDDAVIADIEQNVIQFLAEVDQKVAQVLALIDNKTPLTTALESSLASLHLVH